MGKGIQDIGNGLGYIYVTDPSGDIQFTYENTPDNARQVKLDGVKAASFASNRVGTSVITIDAPTGVGSITNITVDTVAIIDVGIPLAYTGATTAQVLAQAIVDAINSYEKGAGFPQHTAVRIDDVVYIFSDTATENGQTPVLVNTGNFTYTVDQDIEGGSSNSEVWDSAIGYNFYLDADYGTTQCSGGGVAVPSSIANAVNITTYIVNIGLQNSIPKIPITISDNAILSVRKGLLTSMIITGEGSAADNLATIILEGVADGDILVLSGNQTITIYDGSNISLQSSTYEITNENLITLIYNVENGVWVELNRSVMEVADNGVTTVKILDANVTTAKIALLAITTALINDLAVTTAKIDAAAVTTAKIDAAAVTAAKVETTLKTEVLSRQISFEASEVGDMKMYMGYPGTVEYLWFVVDKAIAATDNGTIVPKNNAATAMTNGTITATASSAIATSFTATPTANNTFIAGDVLTFTSAKTTAGGKGTLFVKITKS